MIFFINFIIFEFFFAFCLTILKSILTLNMICFVELKVQLNQKYVWSYCSEMKNCYTTILIYNWSLFIKRGVTWLSKSRDVLNKLLTKLKHQYLLSSSIRYVSHILFIYLIIHRYDADRRSTYAGNLCELCTRKIFKEIKIFYLSCFMNSLKWDVEQSYCSCIIMRVDVLFLKLLRDKTELK